MQRGSVRITACSIVGLWLVVGSVRGQALEPIPKGPLRLPEEVTAPPAGLGKDAPYDVAAYFKAPPANQNAYTLYLDAFGDISGEMIYLVPEAQRERFRQLLLDRAREISELHGRFTTNPNAVPVEDLERLVTRFAPVIDKIRLAQQRPACVFPVGISFTTLLPQVQAARAVTNLLELKTAADLARGRVDAAIDNLAMILRLARDIRSRGPIISQLVGNAIEAVVYRRMIVALIAAQGLDPARLDRVLAMLKDHETKSLDPVVSGLKHEFLSAYTLLNDAGSPGFADRLAKLGLQLSITDRLAAEALRNPAPKAAALGKLNRFYSQALKLAETATPGKATCELADRMNTLGKEAAIPLAGYTVPGSRASQSGAVIRANLHAAAAMVMIRRWFVTNRNPPASFSLAPYAEAAKLPVPVDPFSNQPLKLAMVNNRLVVYSVGPDGRDDQGLVDSVFGSKPQGDIIFPTVPDNPPGR